MAKDWLFKLPPFKFRGREIYVSPARWMGCGIGAWIQVRVKIKIHKIRGKIGGEAEPERIFNSDLPILYFLNTSWMASALYFGSGAPDPHHFLFPARQPELLDDWTLTPCRLSDDGLQFLRVESFQLLCNKNSFIFRYIPATGMPLA